MHLNWIICWHYCHSKGFALPSRSVLFCEINVNVIVNLARKMYSSRQRPIFGFGLEFNILSSSLNVSFCHNFITALVHDRYIIGASKGKTAITLFCVSPKAKLKSWALSLTSCPSLRFFFSSPLFCRLLLGRSVTPFVSITSLSEQRFGGPTCRSPGAGLCSPQASQDYPQRRRQLRPGEEAINLHKLQQATLPLLSLDTQIMHLLLNSLQTDSRGDKSISWFPLTERLLPKVPLQSGPWLIVQQFFTIMMVSFPEVCLGFVTWENVILTICFSGLRNITLI